MTALCTPSETEALSEDLDELVSRTIGAGRCPGAVIAVGNEGRIVIERAWGHAMLEPERRSMHEDTIFDLASLTKGLATGIVAAVLVDQQRLRLDDRAGRLLPEFRGGGKDEITLIDLFTHTSGLSDRCLYDPDASMRNLSDDVWAAICTSSVTAAPKSRYLYQDANYIVLGKALEAAASMSLDRAFELYVAAPLGLRDTGFVPAVDKRDRIAATERIDGEVLVGVVHDPRARQLGGIAGHAGLFGTAREVMKIGELLLNGGVCEGRAVLSRESAELLCRPQSPSGMHPRCLGWDTDPSGEGPRGGLFSRDGFGHTGFTGTSLWVDLPTRTLLVILTNRLHPNGTGDVRLLRRAAAELVARAVQR